MAWMANRHFGSNRTCGLSEVTEVILCTGLFEVTEVIMHKGFLEATGVILHTGGILTAGAHVVCARVV
jgi:hypothetical protein